MTDTAVRGAASEAWARPKPPKRDVTLSAGFTRPQADMIAARAEAEGSSMAHVIRAAVLRELHVDV